MNNLNKLNVLAPLRLPWSNKQPCAPQGPRRQSRFRIHGQSGSKHGHPWIPIRDPWSPVHGRGRSVVDKQEGRRGRVAGSAGEIDPDGWVVLCMHTSSVNFIWTVHTHLRRSLKNLIKSCKLDTQVSKCKWARPRFENLAEISANFWNFVAFSIKFAKTM